MNGGRPEKRVKLEGEPKIDLKSNLVTFQEDWGISDAQIDSAISLMKTDKFDKFILDEQLEETEAKLCLFLYAKGVLAKEEESMIRKAKFLSLLNGRPPKALDRLRTIVFTGETSPIRTESESATLFDEFVRNHPEWSPGVNVFVLHRDHPKLAGKEHALVERCQKSGLCYMHAAVVIQHYLVAMNQDEKVPMLNLGLYLRRRMNAKRLYEHIWNNGGGSSYAFLESILDKEQAIRKIFVGESLLKAGEQFLKNFHDYGPSLVSGFQLTVNFNNTDSWQHLGKPSGQIVGGHAMLLIGYRYEGKQIRFLLQNWWSKKAYCEIDSEYLAYSRASVDFMTVSQERMGNFAETYETYVECDENMEAEEGFDPEW